MKGGRTFWMLGMVVWMGLMGHELRRESTGARELAAVGEVCRRVAPVVYWGSFLLPKEKRDAVLVAGAFVGMMGEAMRGTFRGEEQRGSSTRGETGGGQSGGCCGEVSGEVVGLLRERVDEIYAGAVDLPPALERTAEQWVVDVFARTVREYQVPRTYVDELLSGLVAEQATARYATWDSVRSQLYRTGGSAARIVCSILGVTSSDAMAQLSQIGVAGGLTLALMDLGEDVGAGRVRLPLEDLVRVRCSERELMETCSALSLKRPGRIKGSGLLFASAVSMKKVNLTSFLDLVQFEVERAEGLYREGEKGIEWVATDGGRLFAAAVCAQGRGLLRAIRRRGFDVIGGRPRLTHLDRLRMLPEVWRLARRGSMQ